MPKTEKIAAYTNKFIMIEMQEKLNELKITLNEKQQTFFNIKSVQNYLIFYHCIKDKDKEIVRGLLFDYFKIMEKEKYHINIDK